MALHARSDVMHVAVPVESGGCGAEGGHSRPVVQGAPVKLWRLDCPQCCSVLSKDPLWSGTIAEIPETPDEKLSREDLEKRGARTQQQVLAVAMAKLAGMPEAAGVLQSLAGAQAITASSVACPEGHPNASGAKFCAECGSPVKVTPTVVTCPGGHENPAASKFCAECGAGLHQALPEDGAEDLSALSDAQLRALARKRGISASGKKAEVLARLKAA